MKLRNIFAVALAGVAFTACSEDDAPDQGTLGNETAYVGLNLTLPASAFTKAVDANANTTETAVSKVTVYGQSNGLITKLGDLTKDDFTVADNKYTVKESGAIKVSGKVGDKMDIYVTLNGAVDFEAAQMLGTKEYAATTAVTALASNFLMSNFEAGTATMEATPTDAIAAGSKADVTVERAVAKVLVKKSNDFPTTEQFADAGAGGNFVTNTLKWGIGNSPKQLFVRRDVNGKSPAYTYTSTDGFTEYDAKYEVICDATGVITTAPAIAVAPSDVPVTGFSADGATSYVAYSNENTHETYVLGNTTYALITADFIPTTLWSGNLTGEGNALTGDASSAPSAAETFYYHVRSNKYFSATAVEGYTGAEEFIGPFTDGKCYYRVPVWNKASDATKAKGTERNTFYTLSIKNLTAPGSPIDPTYPNPNDPNEPVETYIAVDIDIAAWQSASMGDDVELK